MPYIKQEQRDAIEPAIHDLVEAIKRTTVYQGTALHTPEPDGCINYAITRMLQDLITPNSYVKHERCIGLLESCKLEFYRRGTAPYENKKANENGDVFEWQDGGQLLK